MSVNVLRSASRFLLAVLAVSFGLGWGFTYFRSRTAERKSRRRRWSQLLRWLTE